MVVKNLKELKQFMMLNCYNIDLYGIDNYPKGDGYGIEKWGELYVWYYIERGIKEEIKYFQTEIEIAKFAFEIISNDKFAQSHLLVSFQDLLLKEEIISILKNRKIEFWFDEIPYLGGNNKLVRFFIVGCDINKVHDLKIKYNFR